ncbi:cyclic AMP-dependent transcription factor ATF-3 [Corythoichthys intestinalis]|uniref:cyclic AMP-dependent transcription factor ATF-3 n=1 Tax=Corythoichthys intestinalis TaxID=161448 RepID=UPI0025A52F11|nr:cyclic AMP-dependent transcription factor ATF-3 [Corythoichthys intestinalis]XP_061806305.1 cyclic AMP-dependent transcription factor ATF-3-like [Nerophis lumbriciformis]
MLHNWPCEIRSSAPLPGPLTKERSRADPGGKSAQLSPAEADRRKRRRENNKAAAAKCRKKKKDRTEYLMQESEKLESVNVDLKAQIKSLNQQKQQLSHMLNQHRPTCIVRAQNGRTPDDESDPLVRRLLRSAVVSEGDGSVSADAGEPGLGLDRLCWSLSV